MLAKIYSVGVLGIEGYPVEVEVDLSGGLPSFSIVGLPDPAVRESADRVRGAIRNSGFDFPLKRITVNLAPCELKKEGPAFDLPIALGILRASGQLPEEAFSRFAFCGELSLDGMLRPIRGVLPRAVTVGDVLRKNFIVPKGNAFEAAIVRRISVYPMGSLSEAVWFLRGGLRRRRFMADIRRLWRENGHDTGLDFQDVRGQRHAKRALEIAAAGGHHLLLIGPPGAGKTMLAKRLPTILSPLSHEEAIESTKIHSVSGRLSQRTPFLTTRPFRTPHHTISDVGLVGGTAHPKPGEVSLAHNGVLFMDELPEFKRHVLEVLRQPLEEGEITLTRAETTMTYPAAFLLVCAMNPCPCGHLSDPRKECRCTPYQLERYRARISGPLLDRIDIHLEVPPLPFEEMTQGRPEEPSRAIRERVLLAQERQRERYRGQGPHFCNARLGPREIAQHCNVSEAGRGVLRMAIQRLGFSMRAHDRILKLARTIADLDGSEILKPLHISEAAGYRSLDRSPSEI